MKKSTSFAIVLTLISSSAFASMGPFTTKVAFTTNRDGNSEIYTMNPNGSTLTRLTNNTSTDTHASYSLDGKKIAFMSSRDGNNEIYVMNADGTNQTRVTNNAASDSQPAWSPDGTRIVFLSARAGGLDIFSMLADGSGVVQLTNDPGSDTDPSFSPAGDKIAFVSNRDGNNEIYTMNPNGSVQTRLTNNTVLDTHPRFSRKGDKITLARHVLDSTGFNVQVVVMNANGTGAAVLTATGANNNPFFNADGSRIFFDSNRDLNPELYSMKVDGSNEVRLTNNTFTDSTPSVQGVFEVETVGVYRPSTGQWVLTMEDFPGLALFVEFGGQPGDLPVAGNWNGDDRTDIGVFRDGTFHLGLLTTGALGHVAQEIAPFAFGQPGDLPLAGDWDGDGKDDVGVFRPGPIGKFLLRQPRRFGAFNVITTISFDFGTTGDLPVAGDWDGDGIDTPGVYRPGDPGPFILTNTFTGTVDATFNFGGPNDLPLAGDFLGVDIDGVGLFLPGSLAMILATDIGSKPGLLVSFGQPGDIPVAGSWTP